MPIKEVNNFRQDRGNSAIAFQVIDDFFTNPYEVRNKGLKSLKEHCCKCPTGGKAGDFTWPGVRSPLLGNTNIDNSFKDRYINAISPYLKEKCVVKESYFQSIDYSWVCGSFHNDYPARYTCITFLTPQPHPNSGTELIGMYPDVQYHTKNIEEVPVGYQLFESDEFEPVKRRFYSSERNPIQRFFFEKKVKSYNSIFDETCIIANRFNRTIVFDSCLYHRAQDFFGTILSESRLTLISFWYAT